MKNNTVFLVVEHSFDCWIPTVLEGESFKNLAAFSSKDNAENFIQKLDRSCDQFEYSITEFIVDNWIMDC